MFKKAILLFFVSKVVVSQVQFPVNGVSSGSNAAERVSSYTVAGAGNDRLEIVNGTQNDGQFIPTLWSYRSTTNTYGMVYNAAISPNLDSGTSPVMLFVSNKVPQLQLSAPSIGDFPWGNSGTTTEIVTRPVFQWRNNSLKIMTMMPNGNVGVGTVSPTALFHTNGTLRFQNLQDSTNPFKILGTDSNGNVFEYNPIDVAGSASTDEDWLQIDNTFPNSIDNSIYTNGNVGINVQNPSVNFDVDGDIRFRSLQDSTNPFKILGTDSNGNVFEYNPIDVAGSASTDEDWLQIDNTFPNSIDNSIYTNGNVGINVQNPSVNFDVDGNIRFRSLQDSTNPFKILGTDSNGNVFEYNPIDVAGSASTDEDWLQIDNTFPNSIDNSIYTNGNVGINVQNPSVDFDVDGDIRFRSLQDSTNPFKILGTDSNGNVFEYNPIDVAGSASTDEDWLQTDNTFPNSIDNSIYTNGNVGINVQNPSVDFDVDGDIRFRSLQDSTNPFKILGTDSNGNVFEYNPIDVVGSASTDEDWLQIDNTFPNSIDNSIYTMGKVAINTNSFPVSVGDEDVSNYNLYVTGGILTEEVRVALVEEWADFVFDENYNLSSLSDVEDYILENKHLEGIPSAKEVKENGIELKEMNKVLLQKVEELTLYIIELNKKLDKQQEEINKLKNEK